MNCRSLKPKLDSLIENFLNNKCTVGLLTETWFNRRDSQLKKKLEEVSNQEKIRFIRKDHTSRGGGVAIAFDADQAEFKRLPLASLKKL